MLKLMYEHQPKCSWSLLATKRRGDEFWEIEKYKSPHTCVNLIINWDPRQFGYCVYMDYDQAIGEG